MSRPLGAVAVLDREPASSDFLSEVIAGLSSQPRTLPCKFFYDERGAALFQKICDLPEYYITRTELQILRLQGAAIAATLGPQIQLIGLGTGAGTKTRILLEELQEPAVYVPIDISKDQLQKSTARFREIFPHLEILPVCADYLEPFELPSPERASSRKVVYFPGSTVGNFEPRQAKIFFRRIANFCRTNGGLLIGVDLRKDRHVLESAYNDSAGVTAEFNLNLLARANRELGAKFDLNHWRHRAIYNSIDGRIEMHLISDTDQTVRIEDRQWSRREPSDIDGQPDRVLSGDARHQIHFRAGEKIITEYSYKYAPDGFIALAREAGFEFVQMWTDNARLFGVFYFSVAK
jgi:dimethylhistidine N-methyltransferase